MVFVGKKGKLLTQYSRYTNMEKKTDVSVKVSSSISFTWVVNKRKFAFSSFTVSC